MGASDIIGFAETPDSLIAAIGERAIFNCQHCTTLEIDWQLNGTIVPSINLPANIYVDYAFPDDPLSLTCGGIYSLVFADISTYNETVIQCEANIHGVPNEASDPALLLTQGIVHKGNCIIISIILCYELSMHGILC